jgi:hypothetical protein
METLCIQMDKTQSAFYYYWVSMASCVESRVVLTGAQMMNRWVGIDSFEARFALSDAL